MYMLFELDGNVRGILNDYQRICSTMILSEVETETCYKRKLVAGISLFSFYKHQAGIFFFKYSVTSFR